MATIFPLRPDPVYPDAKSPTAFQDGLEFQDFVCMHLARHNIILQNVCSKKYQITIGENLQGYEIKFDDLCTKTGRLSIEIAEKPRNDPQLLWTPSGICRGDNSWLYIQGNYHTIFIFAKRTLLKYHTQVRPEVTEKMGTIRTFYFPISLAENVAAKVLRIIETR